MRIEQVITGRQLKRQACRRPDVGSEVVGGSEEHFDGSVLSRLDVVREVMILKVNFFFFLICIYKLLTV